MADLPDYYTAAQLTLAEVTAIFGGLDAAKSVDPDAKDVYLATDTNRLYICFTDGAWTNVSGLYLPLAGGTLTGALIIHEDTYIQFGTAAVKVRILPYLSVDAGGVVIRPATDDRLGYLELQPKGTSERALISLHNVEGGIPATDYSAFGIEVDGDRVNMIFEDVGTPPTSLAHVYIHNTWEMRHVRPITDNLSDLGTLTKRWQEIFALRHHITQAIGTDHKWSGTTTQLTAGTALTIGQAVYVGADSKMEKALATAAATMPAIALATGTIAENASGEFLMQGFFRDDTWDWTPGGLLYISRATAGALTQTLPAIAGEQVQVVGVAITADIIHFNPSYELVEIS